jgi:guanylate kinase
MAELSKTQDPFQREQTPLLIVISGPSGAGKDSVVQRMQERGFPFHFVVTATDRPPRDGEVHGKDYYFYSTEEFEDMITNGELLEHAWVYGQHKGIPRAHILEALSSGQDVVMRIDVQGVATIMSKIPGAITVFLTCESEEELVARLRDRRADSEEQLRERLAAAVKEMARIPEFNYVVVNRHCKLDAAVDDVLDIVRAEQCRAVPGKIEL